LSSGLSRSLHEPEAATRDKIDAFLVAAGGGVSHRAFAGFPVDNRILIAAQDGQREAI
jgi:hypothetical protein